jgi:poly(A) polymerase
VEKPQNRDLLLTAELKKALKPYGVFDTEEGLQHRIRILTKLNEMVKRFVQMVRSKKDQSQDITKISGKIYTFGSYRLGVHTQGADIDTLCVVPIGVERGDFFSEFYDMLKSAPGVEDVRAIENAFVPVIKLYFENIEMDILFAKLNLNTITDNQELREDILLRNLDIQCVRSLNGCRVTDEILHLVPNIDAFRLTLRVIKLWAKRRGIYSNAMGFLGGVSWAMLTARICQLYPNACAATLVHKFFTVYKQWEWPKPVMLRMPDETLAYHSGMNHSVWDPRYNPTDRLHLMPIITPAYPQQNSTYNVTRSTLTVMKQEFRAGFDMTKDIFETELDPTGSRSNDDNPWRNLFQQPNFFSTYKHFLVLTSTARGEASFKEWSGLIEAKARILIQNLERNQYVLIAHVNPEPFTFPPILQDNETNNIFTYQVRWFVGLNFQKEQVPAGQTINLTDDIQRFTDVVYQHAKQSGMYKETMSITCEYCKRKEITDMISPDKKAWLKDCLRNPKKQKSKKSDHNNNSNTNGKKKDRGSGGGGMNGGGGSTRRRDETGKSNNKQQTKHSSKSQSNQPDSANETYRHSNSKYINNSQQPPNYSPYNQSSKQSNSNNKPSPSSSSTNSTTSKPASSVTSEQARKRHPSPPTDKLHDQANDSSQHIPGKRRQSESAGKAESTTAAIISSNTGKDEVNHTSNKSDTIQ